MVLDGKPFKSFKTLNSVIVREGDMVSFTTTTGQEVEGTVLSINTKEIKIQSEDDFYSKNVSYLDIEEGTIQTI